MSEENTELTTIDEEHMTTQEQDIYHRRMRVLKNAFLPKDQRLTQEALADKEQVARETISRDASWLRKIYPNLWASAQVKHGFAYTMMEVSEMYSSMIKELYDDFWKTTDIGEKIAIAKTLNDLMPTYTNSKAHGTVLEKIKNTVKDETQIN